MDLRGDVRGKLLDGSSHIHKLARITLLRFTEIAIYQLSLQVGHHETTVTLFGDLVIVEPILEALLVEIEGLRIDTVMFEGCVQRRLQILHLERQPTARARGVVQELLIITRAAK